MFCAIFHMIFKEIKRLNRKLCFESVCVLSPSIIRTSNILKVDFVCFSQKLVFIYTCFKLWLTKNKCVQKGFCQILKSPLQTQTLLYLNTNYTHSQTAHHFQSTEWIPVTPPNQRAGTRNLSYMLVKPTEMRRFLFSWQAPTDTLLQ